MVCLPCRLCLVSLVLMALVERSAIYVLGISVRVVMVKFEGRLAGMNRLSEVRLEVEVEE